MTSARVLAVVAAGGVLGACARYAVSLGWPPAPGEVPWSTLAVNVSGCLLIGLLMAWAAAHGERHPLVRPFLGVGVLGGYTTFSAYAVEAHGLLQGRHALLGLGYLVLTVPLAVVAAAVGLAAGRRLLGRAAR